LSACATIAIMNWSVNGSIGRLQNAAGSAPFPVSNCAGNRARLPRDEFLDTTGKSQSKALHRWLPLRWAAVPANVPA
jgi:hypothetical protein